MKLLTLALELLARGAAFVAALLFVRRGEKIKELEDENKALEARVETVDGLRALDADARRRLLASWARRNVSWTSHDPANDTGHPDDK